MIQLQFTVLIVLLQLFDSLLMLLHQLFGLDKLFVLLLTFELILHHSGDVVLYLSGHLLLHACKSLSFFIELLCFGNDFFFLAVKTVVDIAFFSLFLQQANSLHRSLALHDEGADLIHIRVLHSALVILADVLVDAFEQILHLALLVDIHFYFYKKEVAFIFS